MNNTQLNHLINISAFISIIFNILAITTILNIYNIGYNPLQLGIVGMTLLAISWIIPTADPLRVV
jgi:sorbitol-specific phosphotransferase system component IIBC